jgi:hypothetical protein
VALKSASLNSLLKIFMIRTSFKNTDRTLFKQNKTKQNKKQNKTKNKKQNKTKIQKNSQQTIQYKLRFEPSCSFVSHKINISRFSQCDYLQNMNSYPLSPKEKGEKGKKISSTLTKRKKIMVNVQQPQNP